MTRRRQWAGGQVSGAADGSQPQRDTVTGALSVNLEDHLEAIFHLSAHDRTARAKDISGRLKVRSPSVTGSRRRAEGSGLLTP